MQRAIRLTPEDLDAVRSQRPLAEAILAGCPLQSLQGDGSWGDLVVALLRNGLPRAAVARYVGEALLQSAPLRSLLLHKGRPGLYADTIRILIAEADLATLPLPVAIEVAEQLFDTGRPRLALALLDAAGRTEQPGVCLVESRCRAILGQHAESRALLERPVAAHDPDRHAYMRGWMAFHQPLGTLPTDEVRALQHATLSRLWPDVRLPALDRRHSAAPAATVEAWLASLPTEPDAFTVAAPGDPRLAALAALPLTVESAPFAELMAAAGRAGSPADLAPADPASLFDTHMGVMNDGLMRAKLPPCWLARSVLAGEGMSIACPWTGRLLTTRHLVALDPPRFLYGAVFLAEKAEQCFMLVSTGWNFFRKDLLLIPHLRIAVRIGEWNAVMEPSQAAHLVCKILRHFTAALVGFLARDARPAIHTGAQPNVAHHYHNELSGLQQAADAGQLGPHVPVVIGNDDFYDLSRAFDLQGGPHVQRAAAAAATKLALERGWSLVNPRSIAAPTALADRLVAMVGAGSAAPAPAVLFMLRTNRRVWLSQATGIAEAIVTLHESFLIDAFLLDGVTRSGPATAHLKAWVAREQAVADDICQHVWRRCPGLAITSLVGATVAEKLDRHRAVLFSVCPKGNGMLPNLSWIANRPAVVHGNAQDVGGATWEAKYRPDGLLPLVIDRDEIIDDIGEALDAGETTLTGGQVLDLGYDLKLEGFLALVVELAADLAQVRPARPGARG